MIKLPSAFGEAFAPSGNSFALTYPGVLGSRVGNFGRSVCCADGGDCATAGLKTATMLRKIAMLAERRIKAILSFCTILLQSGSLINKHPSQNRRAHVEVNGLFGLAQGSSA